MTQATTPTDHRNPTAASLDVFRQAIPAPVWPRVENSLRLFTEEQCTVIDRVLFTRNHLIVKSTAGSGKSTLLRVIAEILPRTPQVKGRMGVFAFNGSIAEELKDKLPRDMLVSTFHAFGRQLIARNYPGKIQLVKYKKRNITVAYLKSLGEGMNTKANVSGLVTLVERMLIHLAPNTPETLQALCLEHDLKFPPELDLVAAVKHISGAALAQFEEQGWIDYLDMLYLPLKKGYGRGSMMVMLIDEAQDFSKLQHKLVRHLLAESGRVVYVGDPDQAVYGFTGADASGLDRAQKFFGAEVLHLTYTFRCPRSHVELAARYSEHIRTPEGAKDGEVWRITETELLDKLHGGDLVLSRTNAPMIQLALQLVMRGKDVNVLGTDLKQELGRYFERAFPQPFLAGNIEARLMRAYDLMLEERFQNGENGKTLERNAERDSDMLACCGSIALRAAQAKDGPCTLADVNRVLDEMVVGGEDAINLCTVHKAKGLEARRVAILRPENLQLPSGDPAEEQAVAFVAYTRGKEVLMLANGESDLQEPGTEPLD